MADNDDDDNNDNDEVSRAPRSSEPQAPGALPFQKGPVPTERRTQAPASKECLEFPLERRIQAPASKECLGFPLTHDCVDDWPTLPTRAPLQGVDAAHTPLQGVATGNQTLSGGIGSNREGVHSQGVGLMVSYSTASREPSLLHVSKRRSPRNPMTTSAQSCMCQPRRKSKNQHNNNDNDDEAQRYDDQRQLEPTRQQRSIDAW